MDQMRVSQDVSINIALLPSTDPAHSAFSSKGGNPELKPYKSLNLDLSVEHYFPKAGGYVAFATYYKKLTDFVDPNNATVFDFADLAAGLPPGLGTVGTTLGALTLPANTGDGHIFGQELTVSLPLVNFSHALDGFGFFGTMGHVKSKVKYANQPDAITVPGLSKWVGTAEAYYEKNGFQARVSYRYRSKFLAEIAGLSANPEYRTAKSEGVLDAQIGYEFQEGTFKGFSITAQGKNLTDEPFITYETGDSRLVRDYQRYGRDYYLSFGYRF
jgi:iron complex outermembrane receptor protein